MIDLFSFVEGFWKHIGKLVANLCRYHRIEDDVPFLALARVERHDLEIEGLIEPLGIVLAVDQLYEQGLLFGVVRRSRLFGQLPGRNKLKAGSRLLVSPFPEIKFIPCCCGCCEACGQPPTCGQGGGNALRFPRLVPRGPRWRGQAGVGGAGCPQISGNPPGWRQAASAAPPVPWPREASSGGRPPTGLVGLPGLYHA